MRSFILALKCTRILVLAQLLTGTSFSQTPRADSLKRRIGLSGSKAEEVKNIFAFCDQGYTVHPDTLMSYAERALSIAKNSNNLKDQLWAMFYETSALTTKGYVDSSLALSDKCLAMMQGKLDNELLLKISLINQKGRCYVRKSNYKEAIEVGYQVIRLSEQANDVLFQMKGKTLVGWAYLEMDQLKDALEWHLKALRTATDSVMLSKYAVLFANIATNYNGLGKTDSAFYYINKAIVYARRDENLFALSNSLAIESELFVKVGQARLSEPVLKEVVEIRKMIGDPFYIASDMAQLGFYYAHYGQPEKGIAICNEGIAIAKKYKLDAKLLFLYSSLSDNYKAMGNTAKYAEVLENIISLKDSVFIKNSAEALAEMETKYEVQKKETLIIQQKLDLQQKNYLLYGSVLLLLFTGLVGWLLFREYKRRQRIRLQKMKEEDKILAAVAVNKAEENERKRIAADLHDNLGAYAAAIASNVDQISFHAGETAMQELKINSQSIVSELNDTIWVLKKDNLSLTAISDRIKVFIQRISASYPEIKIDVIERISSDILFPPAQAFHLYQVIKEAIINSLKHSQAKHVSVYFESGGKWKVNVSDDGVGISGFNKNMGKGNGLNNMRHRAKQTGWHIDWKINETGGTSVVVEPATTN